VPAALERQINKANAGKINAGFSPRAANGPTTPEADAILKQRDEILSCRTCFAMRRRGIVSYFEWGRILQSFFWSETEVGR